MRTFTHILTQDIETRSKADIKKVGALNYALDPSTEVVVITYSLDYGPGIQIDRTEKRAPAAAVMDQRLAEYVKLLHDPNCEKRAYNAPFEFSVLSRFFGPLNFEEWFDDMLPVVYAGYPSSLDAAGKALGLGEDQRKLDTGKELVAFFSTPASYTDSGEAIWHEPDDYIEKWQEYLKYNRQDVVAEMAIADKLSGIQIPDSLLQQWRTDLKINLRGVQLDTEMVEAAARISAEINADYLEKMAELTGLPNPNSIQQLKRWLDERGDAVGSLDKKAVETLLTRSDLPPDVRQVLTFRQAIGRAAVKKYPAMLECVCRDGRARGLLRFYAAQTGRWSSSHIQFQNLARVHLPYEDQKLARKLIRSGNVEMLSVLYGDITDVLAQLVRTALIPSPGNVFIDADFSAIEARVLAWVAGEKWTLEAFARGKDIYCETASMMFGIPVTKHDGTNNRQKGKTAALGLGYGGGVEALKRMGALEAGLQEEELPDIVQKWREANPHIVHFWYDINEAAIAVVQNGGSRVVGKVIIAKEFDMNTGHSAMSILLPSGRKLYYRDPVIELDKWGRDSVNYVDRTGKKTELYGGKIAENVTQAVARDLLAEAIERLEASGYPVVCHVHDEVLIDIRPYADSDVMLSDVVKIMSQNPSWASGLPIAADGWVGDFFTKD